MTNCLRGALASCLAWTLGCGSTGVGNPDDEIAKLSLAIVSDDDDPSGPTDEVTARLDAGDGELGDGSLDAGVASGDPEGEPLPRGSLERAVIVLGSIEWLPCDPSLPGVVQRGPFVVDLLGLESRQAPPPVSVPEGGFCGFDAALAPARDSAGLLGRSLYFAGTRADGVGFLLFADVRATLRLRAEDGTPWGRADGEPEQRLLWAHAPRRWARRADLDPLTPIEWGDGRRSIVIDVNRHPLLFALIRTRLGSESRVFLDRNNDGSLDLGDRNAGAIGTGSTD